MTFFKKFKLNNYTKKLKQTVPFWAKRKSKKRDIIVKKFSNRTWSRGNAKI